jgi:hypothetical protein
MFFVAQIKSNVFKIDKSEIASYCWLNKEELIPDKFAFISMKHAIKKYLNS